MNISKIQKLRIHKQHLFIRAIAWLTILTFLITLLFMGFPIVSNASSLSWNIEDRYWTKALFDKSTMAAYLTSINKYDANLLNAFSDDPFQYYDQIKDIFSLPLDDQYGSPSTSTGVAIFISSDNNIYVMYNFTSTAIGWENRVGYCVFNNVPLFNKYDPNNHTLIPVNGSDVPKGNGNIICKTLIRIKKI